ncbi:MAG: hypothetical protein V6D39_16740 [Dolichospermum lemmermannii FEM_B0920]
MKLRNLDLALTAVCATVAGVVGTANNAYAGTATADINFSGSMSEACAFTAVNPGSVVMSGTNITLSNPGAATVTCSGAGTITLSDPVQTSGTSLTFTTKAAYLNSATARVLQSPSGANNNYPKSRSISSVTENYLIYMDMTTSALIPSGSYNFKTTLTATY